MRATNTAEPTAVGIKVLERGFDSFSRSYDTRNAGAPKFPRPVAFNFLLRYYSRSDYKKALDMSLATLGAMAKGGMYDHIGGGFHRYATDAKWHVPHYEKMLYDQAQLVNSYLEAYQITHDPFYADVARDVLAYVQRNLTHSQGGFYSAEDAESAIDPAKPEHKEEGAFYTWIKAEIDSILTPEEARVFNARFGVRENGNVQSDPHREFVGENILFIAKTREETAKQLNLSVEQVQSILAQSREKLFEVRAKRPRPHLDDKVLVSWNGLMISAFARAYQVLEDQTYLRAAEKAAQFILDTLYDEEERQLLREIHSRFIPNKIILLADGARGQEKLASFIPFIKNVKMIDGKPTAYICQNYACQLPTYSLEKMAELLMN